MNFTESYFYEPNLIQFNTLRLAWLPHFSSLEDWCWSWSSNTLATWCQEPTHWKRPWCWERLKKGGEGDDTGWDGWMASLTSWTGVWASSGSWWWTEKPGVLQSMYAKSWIPLSDWTELNQWGGNLLALSIFAHWKWCSSLGLSDAGTPIHGCSSYVPSHKKIWNNTKIKLHFL